jgi:hypothetical protein
MNMNKPGISVSKLLEQAEYEIETAHGGTAWVCRDEHGDFWVVDGAERAVSLHDFADRCQVAARESAALGRAESVGRIAAWTKETFARIVKRLQGTGAKTAHA